MTLENTTEVLSLINQPSFKCQKTVPLILPQADVQTCKVFWNRCILSHIESSILMRVTLHHTAFINEGITSPSNKTTAQQLAPGAFRMKLTRKTQFLQMCSAVNALRNTFFMVLIVLSRTLSDRYQTGTYIKTFFCFKESQILNHTRFHLQSRKQRHFLLRKTV